jgi:hypothetical protein
VHPKQITTTKTDASGSKSQWQQQLVTTTDAAGSLTITTAAGGLNAQSNLK